MHAKLLGRTTGQQKGRSEQQKATASLGRDRPPEPEIQELAPRDVQPPCREVKNQNAYEC